MVSSTTSFLNPLAAEKPQPEKIDRVSGVSAVPVPVKPLNGLVSSPNESKGIGGMKASSLADSVPPLNVPCYKKTFESLLAQSNMPERWSGSELAEFKANIKSFMDEFAVELQKALEKDATNEEGWISGKWRDGYLKGRESTAVNISFSFALNNSS